METRRGEKLFQLSKKETHLTCLPIIEKFQHTKLPLLKEVISLVYKRTEKGYTFESAVKHISQLVEKHWTDRNIYTYSHQAVMKKLNKHLKEYRYLSKVDTRRQGESFIKRCNAMNTLLDSLFDIFCHDKNRLKKLEQQHGIPMQKEEYEFLNNMRGDRSYVCDKVDVLYHKEQDEKLRKLEKKKMIQSSNFETVSFEEDVDDDAGIIDTENPYEHTEEQSPVAKKKLKFVDTSTPIATISTRTSASKVGCHIKDVPSGGIHVRTSKNAVLSEIYHACADMDGEGFSLREIQVALKVVANTIFKTEWKIPEEKDRISKYDHENEEPEQEPKETIIDSNTLPTRSAIRKKLKQMQAYSLGLIANEINSSETKVDIITHATDSTTRKHVGTFAPSGLHINRDKYLPLPTLQITSETTEIYYFF